MSKRALRPPLVIAHRGYSARHPENTLESFSAAFRCTNALETDIRRTNDGLLVTHHDRDLVTPQGLLPLSALTHREIEAQSEQHPPTLIDVLAVTWREAPESSILVLEVKNDDPAVDTTMVAVECARIVEGVVRLCNPFPRSFPARVVITTNHLGALRAVNEFIQAFQADDVLNVGFTILHSPHDLPAFIAFRRSFPDAFVSVPRKLAERFPRLFRDRSLVYTVNDVQGAMTLFDNGIAGVFTDDVELIVAVRDARELRH